MPAGMRNSTGSEASGYHCEDGAGESGLCELRSGYAGPGSEDPVRQWIRTGKSAACRSVPDECSCGDGGTAFPQKPDSTISVKVEFGEGEGKVPLDNIAKRAEAYKPKERVTYKMIKEYIEAKYGFKVHTAYIAEVKRSLGLPMYDAPNAVEELKQPRKHPAAEKVEAIKGALRYFGVI